MRQIHRETSEDKTLRSVMNTDTEKTADLGSNINSVSQATADHRTNDIYAIKEFLLSQRREILNKSLEFKNEQKRSDFKERGDEAEAASSDIDLSLSYQFQERDRMVLVRIDHALGKIDTGSFGTCEGCGAEIAIKRLQVRPFAELCIDCQEEQEESQRSPQP